MNKIPILFNGPMITAILNGHKTQTRRPVKPQPSSPGEGAYFDAYNGGPQWNWWAPDNRQYLSQIIKCPFGQPGDLLYVRETWRPIAKGEVPGDVRYGTAYRADGHVAWDDHTTRIWITDDAEPSRLSQIGTDVIKWCPSVHMATHRARIWLRVKEIRVERAQDISEENATAEGVEAVSVASVPRQAAWSNRQDFARIWDSIYTTDLGWDENPWVWVVEFERVEQEARVSA